MLEYLKELKLETKADNLRHNDWLEGFGTKQGDQIHTNTQVKKDMVDQMNLPEDGAFRTDPNSGVQIPTTKFENDARMLGIERNINTPSLGNSRTSIDNSIAEWAAEQAAYDADREAARLAGIKERWLARRAEAKKAARLAGVKERWKEDALKILKEKEEQLARRTKDSGAVKREYTGNQEFDIGPDGFIIPTKK